MENSKRVFEKILLKEYTLWLDRYFASSIDNLSEGQLKTTYGTRVGVDAYSHWAFSPVVLRFILLKYRFLFISVEFLLMVLLLLVFKNLVTIQLH